MPRAKETPIPGPNFADFAATSASAVAAPPDDVAGHVADDKAPGAPPVEMSPGQLLASKVADRKAAADADVAEQTERAWQCYRRVLLSEKPTDADLQNLVDACQELSIDAATVAADRQIIEEARKQLAYYAAREQNAKALSEARTASLNLQRKQREEQEVVRKAQQAATGPAEASYDAAYKLVKLARARPQLFDLTSDPPQLRKD